MSFTYGFYNSLNHDRVYDATVIGQLFDGMIMDGVYSAIGDKFIVHASGQGMRVNVGSGRAWFNHTWNFNDTNLPIEPEQSEVILDRIDALVLDINTAVEYRENQIMFVKGTPSSQPVRPTLIHEDGHYQYPLAYILIPASSTEVFEANITNMVGTDECPFATGLLQQVSTSELIEQWGAEWRLWSDTQKAAFISWMNSEEAAYDTWSDAQKAAFTLWMTEEKDEFDEWFEHIQDILDEDVAAHLQNEIDEIMRDGMLGSIFRITTSDTELYGMRVTVTNGTVSKYADFDSSGVAEIKSYEEIGDLHFSSTDGHRTAHYDLSVPYYGVYDIPLNFWAATVNISTSSSVLFGKTITVEKDGVSAGTAVFSAGGSAVYTATGAGLYSFSVSYEEGGETRTVTETLNITEETTYSIIFSVGFDYLSWLNAGGVSGTYTSLDDVLADEKAVRKLMTKHASVDYLASFTADDASVVTILNNDLAAKWITVTAYAEDTLTAAYSALMESIGKYGYGEWALMGQVPKLSADSASVIASSTYSYSGVAKWKVFDGISTGATDSDVWEPATTNLGEWIGYDFGTPVAIQRVDFVVSAGANVSITWAIESSDDGSTWSNPYASNEIEYVSRTLVSSSKSFDNTTVHRYWRVRKTAQTTSSYGYIKELQFYAWQPKGNVPIMTANNAPYGEAFCSSVYSSSYAAWKTFNPNENVGWDPAQSDTLGSAHVGYKATTPICVTRYMIDILNQNSQWIKFKLQGSNDGTTYYDIGSEQQKVTGAVYYIDVDNSTYYLYHRILITGTEWSGTIHYLSICNLQFYGRQMTVSVPTMTSNTTPYGEASAETTVANAWKAFDNDATTYWGSGNSSADHWIQYKFVNPVIIKMVVFTIRNDKTTKIVVKGSNDNVNFTPLSEQESFMASGIITLQNSTPYLYYRLETNMPDGAQWVTTFNMLQFFGFDYSEKEWDTEHPRHYIYDNGLELEIMSGHTSGTASVTEESSRVKVYCGSTANGNQSEWNSDAKIDLTNFSMMRAVSGLAAIYSGGYSFWLGIASAKSNGFIVSQTGFAYSGMLSANAPYSHGFDISSVNGEYFVGVGRAQAVVTETIEELWLE